MDEKPFFVEDVTSPTARKEMAEFARKQQERKLAFLRAIHNRGMMKGIIIGIVMAGGVDYLARVLTHTHG